MAPGSIPLAPKAIQAIPKASKNIPIPYFIFAEGLYLLSHNFENNGANVIINKEFNVENQVAGNSVNGKVTFSIFKNYKVPSDKDK